MTMMLTDSASEGSYYCSRGGRRFMYSARRYGVPTAAAVAWAGPYAKRLKRLWAPGKRGSPG